MRPDYKYRPDRVARTHLASAPLFFLFLVMATARREPLWFRILLLLAVVGLLVSAAYFRRRAARQVGQSAASDGGGA